MSKVKMYVTGYCPYCTMAERLLRAKGVSTKSKRYAWISSLNCGSR
jgi:glutaredoxin 3